MDHLEQEIYGHLGFAPERPGVVLICRLVFDPGESWEKLEELRPMNESVLEVRILRFQYDGHLGQEEGLHDHKVS